MLKVIYFGPKWERDQILINIKELNKSGRWHIWHKSANSEQNFDSSKIFVQINSIGVAFYNLDYFGHDLHFYIFYNTLILIQNFEINLNT